MTGSETDADGKSTAASAGASRLISATAVMAAGTGMSRVLGFLKAVLLGVALGYGTRQADMFSFANVVPQAIYLLLAGGVLNTVFVPQIVRAMHEDDDGGEAFTNRLITLGMTAIAGIAVIATVAAPLIMSVYLDGQWRHPDLAAQFDSVVMLAYFCLPQIFFYGITVMLGQVLNARGRFGPMMWAPVLNNVVGIASIGLFLLLWPGSRDLGAPFTLQQELVLGLGATLGIVAQSLVLIPFVRAIGFRFRPRFDFRHTGLGRAGHVAKWTVGYMIVTQLALVVVSRLASSAVPSGHGAGWTVYQNANLIFMLPHSLITVSLVTAMLPSTSRLVISGDLAGARDEVTRTMRLTVAALLPASLAFLALAFPITAVLFAHGNGSEQSGLIGWTLIAFAIGLVPFTLQYVCLRAFYALEDTRTTFFLQILIASVNVLVALLLVLPIGKPNWVAPGLALAYASAYLIGLGVSFHQLGKKLPGLRGREIIGHCVRVFLAALPAAGIALLITWGFGHWSDSFFARVLALAVAGVVAVGVYLAMARVLRISEVNQIISTVLRRGTGGTTGTDGSDPESPADEEEPAGLNRAADDSGSVGGSVVPAAPESGTIGAGMADAAAAGSWPAVDAATEALTVTRIRQAINLPAGQQAMTGGKSEQSAEAMADEDLRQPPNSTDPDQTAEFSLAELEAAADEPASADDTNPGGSHSPLPVDHLPAGAVLASRYRLEELLASTGNTARTWRAFDLVLSRSVVIHLLPVGDERSADLLAAGRRAAAATDSRFLRVLDAVGEGGRTPDGELVGSYIVSEYAKGQSLQSLLTAAPLTGLESAWLIREVADALSGAHARGLQHCRLNPDTVIITPSGNIKIVGLLIEAALRPQEYASAPSGAHDLEAADIHDLGRLLYACLVARWPGGGEFGLPPAPPATGAAQESGHPWLTPRQVRHGVSPTLDRVCDQLLSAVPRQHAPRIVTAAELVGELDRVLGSADASSDLERRLRHPHPLFLSEDTEAEDPSFDTVAATPYAVVERTSSIAAGTNTSSPSRPAAPTLPPTPPTPEPERRRTGPRRWIWLVVIALLIAAVVVTIVTSRGLGPARNAEQSPKAKASATAPAPPQQLKIVDGHDFDPPPGNGEENPDEVKYAYDGDPKTRWRTLSYIGSPKLGNLKPGVGIVFDLGAAKTVGEVKLLLSGDGTNLQIRVPKSDGDAPDLDHLKSWRTVAEQKGAGGSATLTLKQQVDTRYVLVFLTSLPREGGNYRGGIYEAEVLS
ncbi:murein biosynthesis integral membrane protein MurJ [Microlunatus elymi]|uniref:Murein biosynthesis integral membrane protein MurJ n=1 Tax=Microlunatus elymi TaxID=2596828 RepID=A0A516PU84_9ACTN|nr:murein biosynthesis integral membrane protein MurJ [Microlunatus elymi]QDP94737.1 murein biosynthesis integral membrane protein MurJ [Microlunatus elymi]